MDLSTEDKIKRFHFQEVLLILFISATDLSNYGDDDLEDFAENIEGRVEVLFQQDYLKSLNKFVSIDDKALNDFSQLRLLLAGMYQPQWHEKMKEKSSDWKNINSIAKKILDEINIEYIEPNSFRSDDENLQVDWT